MGGLGRNQLRWDRIEAAVFPFGSCDLFCSYSGPYRLPIQLLNYQIFYRDSEKASLRYRSSNNKVEDEEEEDSAFEMSDSDLAADESESDDEGDASDDESGGEDWGELEKKAEKPNGKTARSTFESSSALSS